MSIVISTDMKNREPAGQETPIQKEGTIEEAAKEAGNRPERHDHGP